MPPGHSIVPQPQLDSGTAGPSRCELLLFNRSTRTAPPSRRCSSCHRAVTLPETNGRLKFSRRQARNLTIFGFHSSFFYIHELERERSMSPRCPAGHDRPPGPPPPAHGLGKLPHLGGSPSPGAWERNSHGTPPERPIEATQGPKTRGTARKVALSQATAAGSGAIRSPWPSDRSFAREKPLESLVDLTFHPCGLPRLPPTALPCAAIPPLEPFASPSSPLRCPGRAVRLLPPLRRLHVAPGAEEAAI